MFKLRSAVVAGAIWLLMGADAAAFEPVVLTPTVVKNRIWISVPRDWPQSNAATRKLVAEVGAGLVGQTPSPGADLAMGSLPRPSGMIIRVTLLDTPGEDAISQADMQAEMQLPAAQRQRELDEALSEIMAQMRPALAKVNAPLRDGKASIVRLGGQLALCFQYRRGDVQEGPSTTFWVSQYHVPLGTQKAVITLSFRDRDSAQYLPVVQQMLRSVTIR